MNRENRTLFFRVPVVAFLVATLAIHPSIALGAAKKKSYIYGDPIHIPTKEECTKLPMPSGPPPWQAGERLAYSIDVLGANAGKMMLVAMPPVGKGNSQELPFRALAASNSFFSKIRRVRGRSTSYVRGKDLHPRRYREDSKEGDSLKWAEVVFEKPGQGNLIRVDFQRNKSKGKRNLRYANEAFDPVSAAYYLRTVPLQAGQSLCFDSYAIRALWRVTAKVKGLETITIPAGTFEAWHIEGVAVRVDNPRSHREMHLWISNDERRLPLVAMGVIDLGHVRAQLTSVGVAKGDENEDRLLAAPPESGRARNSDAAKGGDASKDTDENEDETEDDDASPP